MARDETPTSSASTTSTSSSAPSTGFSSSTIPTATVVQPCPAYYPSEIVPQGAQTSIEDLESELPPLRGKDASVVEYLKVLEQHHGRPDDFYNVDDMRFKRHG
ncbi:hypothetical protein BGX30_007031 [Mortierella sp. GBA39]|nr:hypothetical protein BGX30_007031 [Mortierella sp. GBA39]